MNPDQAGWLSYMSIKDEAKDEAKMDMLEIATTCAKPPIESAEQCLMVNPCNENEILMILSQQFGYEARFAVYSTTQNSFKEINCKSEPNLHELHTILQDKLATKDTLRKQIIDHAFSNQEYIDKARMLDISHLRANTILICSYLPFSRQYCQSCNMIGKESHKEIIFFITVDCKEMKIIDSHIIAQPNRCNYVPIIYKDWLLMTYSHLLKVDAYGYDALTKACLFVSKLTKENNFLPKKEYQEPLVLDLKEKSNIKICKFSDSIVLKTGIDDKKGIEKIKIILYGAYAERPSFQKFCDQFSSIDIDLPLSMCDQNVNNINNGTIDVNSTKDNTQKKAIAQPIYCKTVDFITNTFEMDDIFGGKGGDGKFEHFEAIFQFFLKQENILVFVGGLSDLTSHDQEIDNTIWFDFNTCKWYESKYHLSRIVTKTNNIDCIVNNKVYGCRTNWKDFEFVHISLGNRRVNWNIERLFWIGYQKNIKNAKCLIPQLPKDILKKILAFVACFPIFAIE